MPFSVEQTILFVCEVPLTPFEILAGLKKEEVFLAYPTLMNHLGVLVAEGKLRKIIRMGDKKAIYETIKEIPIPKEPEPELPKGFEDLKE
jgi:hypothetical protein